MFWVYVLESGGGKRYIGHTGDLDRRLDEHNSGLCKTTKADHNWRIVYTEQFPTRGDAIKREKWMKAGVGREFIKRATRR